MSGVDIHLHNMGGGTGPADLRLPNRCLPERLANAISEVLKSKIFPCIVRIISYLADGCL